MAEVVAIIDLMDNENTFNTILNVFGLSARARAKLQKDYPSARNLMNSPEETISRVISTQNKEYRQVSAAQRFYINATQIQRILTFRKWTIVVVKEGGLNYIIDQVATFNLEWIEGIQDMFPGKEPEPSLAKTAMSINVPNFIGTS